MAGLMRKSLESLLTTGKYSDFTFTCKGKEFPVHKFVVCVESEFFRAESREAHLDLSDDDPAIVERVLRYLYLAEYEPKQPTRSIIAEITNPSSAGRERLLDHVMLYQFADKAGIASLKDLAFKHLKGDLGTYLSSGRLPQNFPAVARAVFDATAVNDLTLRLAFIQACVSLYDRIDMDQETLEVLEEHEPIAWALGIASKKANKLDSDTQSARFQLLKGERDNLMKERENLMKEKAKLAKEMCTLEAVNSQALMEFATYKSRAMKFLSAMKEGRHCIYCGEMVMETGFLSRDSIFAFECQKCWHIETIT